MQSPSECASHLSTQKVILEHRAGAKMMITSQIKSKYCLKSYCNRVDPKATSNYENADYDK